MMCFAHLVRYAVLLAFLGLVCWLPGFALEGAAVRGALSGRLRGLARWCLGFAFWITLLFVLAVLHQLRPLPVWCTIALTTVAAIVVGIRSPIGVPRTAAALVSWARGLPYALVPAVLLLPGFIIAAGYGVAADAAVYHLTLPKLYLAQGGFRPVAFSVYSNWPLNIELLFALAMLLKDYVLATLVHFGFGVLTLYAIHVGCSTFHRPHTAWLAMVLFLANPVVLVETGWAYVDLAYAFFFLTGFLFMLRAAEDGQDRPTALLLAGITCGVLAGVKINGIAGAGVVGLLYVISRAGRRRERRGFEARSFLARFALPIVLLCVPWLIKSAWYTGNPVYPFLCGWFDGRDWNASLSAQFSAWQRSIGMGRAWLDYLLLPVRVILYGGEGYAHFDGRISVLWIALLPLTLLFGLRNSFVRRCLGAAGAYFVIWAMSSQQMRLLLPVLPLLAIAAAVTIADLLEHIRWARVRQGALWCCLLGCGTAAGLTNADVFRSGTERLRLLAAHGESLRQMVFHPVYRFINERLPKDAKVLSLNWNFGFFLEREYVADSFFEASQVADWLRPATSKAEVRRSLAERGITHVLVGRYDWGIAYPRARDAMLADPGYARILYWAEDDEFLLLELK